MAIGAGATVAIESMKIAIEEGDKTSKHCGAWLAIALRLSVHSPWRAGPGGWNGCRHINESHAGSSA
jgi:hypothetical protein